MVHHKGKKKINQLHSRFQVIKGLRCSSSTQCKGFAQYWALVHCKQWCTFESTRWREVSKARYNEPSLEWTSWIVNDTKVWKLIFTTAEQREWRIWNVILYLVVMESAVFHSLTSRSRLVEICWGMFQWLELQFLVQKHCFAYSLESIE